MENLSPNWLTQGLLDFEYKKYVLLAYLKHVSSSFSDNRLYPFLSDLIFHYNNLVNIRTNKELTTNNFPKKISKIDLENFRIEYEKLIEDDDCLEVIESILTFAIPRLQNQLKEGKEIYEFVEDQISIYPLGVVPLQNELGYLFIKESKERATRVYEYHITIFESASENYRGIRTSYVNTYSVSLSNTLEKIKLNLLTEKPDFPNPAAYVIEVGLSLPHDETVMPVAKRSFVKYLAA